MDLLKPAEAAALMGVSEDTLREIRKAGEIPYINIGRGRKRETPRYDPNDVEAWKTRNKKVAAPCQSSSGQTRRQANIPTTSGSAVADFRAELERRRAAKPSR